MQNSSQIITTNKPTSSFFYRPDALPAAQRLCKGYLMLCRDCKRFRFPETSSATLPPPVLMHGADEQASQSVRGDDQSMQADGATFRSMYNTAGCGSCNI